MPTPIDDPHPHPQAAFTGHMAQCYDVERGLLERLAHYVDGTPYVGGAGLTLERMLNESYRREAGDLLRDMATLGQAMASPADRVEFGRRMVALGQDLLSAGDDIPPPPANGENFTADYSNGGRPVSGEHEAVPVSVNSDADE